jgi:thiol-disulfide isomerase/thioredoxin
MNSHSLLPKARRPRSLAAAVIAFGLIAAACSGGGSDSNDVTAGEVLPGETSAVVLSGPLTATYNTFEGEVASISDFLDKPVVVNFWAAWCPSCVAEMSSAFKPVIAQLGDRVNFIGFNTSDRRSRALDLLEETGVEWINIEDPDGAAYIDLGGFGAMPMTLFISADGEIVDTHHGPLNESLLLSRIEGTLLG